MSDEEGGEELELERRRKVSIRTPTWGIVTVVVAFFVMLTFMCYFITSCGKEVNW